MDPPCDALWLSFIYYGMEQPCITLKYSQKLSDPPFLYISIQHPLDWEHSGVSTQDGGWEIHVTDGKKENHRKHSQPKVVF